MSLPPVYDEGAGAAQAATTKRIAGNELENTEHFVDRRVTLAPLLSVPGEAYERLSRPLLYRCPLSVAAGNAGAG